MTFTRNHARIIFAATLIIIGWSGLGTPLLAVLFSYLALDSLSFLKRRWLTLSVFAVLVLIICWGAVYMVDQTIRNLPRVAEAAIPSIIRFAKQWGLEVPFSDWDSLKSTVLDAVVGELQYLGIFAKSASKQLAFVILGIAIAVAFYINPVSDLKKGYAIENNLYGVFWREFAAHWRSLYQSFKRVMSAQLLISTINTGLTALFLVAVSMPHATLAVVITFFCGMLPIVGNLISNSVIVVIGFTVSPKLGLGALAFLIVLHKLEYFLNSKIIGDTIKNPVWLTLAGLIVGEKLLGITGMILAPVILHFLKTEASQIEVERVKD